MSKQYSHDEILSLCARLEKIYTPAVADTLDDMGFEHQIMESGFTPIIPDAVVAGPAFTIEIAGTRKSTRMAEYDPKFVAEVLTSVFGNMQKGQVVAIDTNGFYGAAAFGELMSATSKYMGGVRAAVIDGPIRDISRILEIEFPVWARGNLPADSIGRTDLVGVGDPVFCGKVRVSPGDVIFADRDGIVVIPIADVDIEQVVVKAEEIVADERRSRHEIRGGASLLEVYKKYGKL
ncbi:MAG: RraA family protein [Dehalococcoidia bacterium]|nr:RraA family protein [Dehalococcoidia bacterium]